MSGRLYFDMRKEGKMENGRKEEREKKSFRFLLSSVLLFSFLFLAFKPKHEYHVSVTQMQFNPALKSFEVSIRIFTDDLERALSQNNGNKRVTIKNDDQNDKIVEQYIQKSFALTDGQKKPAAMKYIGKEQEEDATWVYLEIPFQGGLSGSKLQNSTLMDVFEDQVNMTNVKFGAEKRTFLFKKGQAVHFL
jgi:hypothetical protein